MNKKNNNLIIKTEIDNTNTNNTNISSESNKKVNKLSKSINNNLNSTLSNKLIETNKNSIEEQDISKNNNLTSNNYFYNSHRNPSKHSYIVSKEKDLTEKEKEKEDNNTKNKNQKCITYSNYANSVLPTRIFENPKFNDKIYEEKRQKENVIIKLPEFADFGQIFEGDLNLDLSHLKREEKENLIKSEDLLIIKT